MAWSKTIATLIAATSLAGAGAALAAPPNTSGATTPGSASIPAAPDATAATPTAPVPVQSPGVPLNAPVATADAPTVAREPVGTVGTPSSTAPVQAAQAAPAAAPDQAASPPTATAQAAPAATPDVAAPDASASAQASASPAPAPDASANAPTQVVAFVDTQFPTADANGDGQLSQSEFEGWMGKLKEAELKQAGKPVVQAEVSSYANNAFARADADKNQQVTRTELTQFLQG